MILLIDTTEFDAAAQESALMLLLQAHGMVEMRDLVREVAEVLANSGWRDTGNGAPPQERDVGPGRVGAGPPVPALVAGRGGQGARVLQPGCGCPMWGGVGAARGTAVHGPARPDGAGLAPARPWPSVATLPA